MRNYVKFYINGEWVDPTSPKNLDVINPASEEICAQIALGNDEDCTSSDLVEPFDPISKRHFSAGDFSTLTC